MPVHESSRRAKRDRWPLAFDLEGVPQETAERQRLLTQKQMLEAIPELTPEEEDPMNVPKVENLFATDGPAQPATITDMSRPIVIRVPFQEFPKVLYAKNGSSILVKSKEEQDKKLKAGYTLKATHLQGAQPEEE
jgi:hypothetical protein